MELKEIFEIISLGSSLVFPAIGWTTRNIVAKWRSDALAERIKDKEDIKAWIEGRFPASKEVDGRLKLIEENHSRLQENHDHLSTSHVRLEENHDQLSTRVDRNEERLRVIEQSRWPRIPNPEPRR